MMNALEIRKLTKSYPGFTLDNINLTLPSGCIMGLIGENGAGKSTMIKLILDMIRIAAVLQFSEKTTGITSNSRKRISALLWMR